MTIPGHAPKRKNASHTDRVGPAQRDAGLERIAQATKWTLAGGLIFTGGFVLAAPRAVTSHATSHAAPAATEQIPAPTATPTAPSTTMPQPTVPPAQTPQTPSHATTTARPVVTVPPSTIPPRPAYRPPVRTSSPPVVVSGGS